MKKPNRVRKDSRRSAGLLQLRTKPEAASVPHGTAAQTTSVKKILRMLDYLQVHAPESYKAAVTIINALYEQAVARKGGAR